MDIDDLPTFPNKQSLKEIGIIRTGDLLCNRYEVLSQLGKGGMGIVYKCLDKTSGKSVALKMISPELAANNYEMELTKDNFNLVSDLHHPHIANYNALEFDPERRGYYLIMEFVDGEDIRYYLRRVKRDGADSEKVLLKLLRQAADALDYAHGKKIVHKDIKPANMMVDRDGNLKLLDFGLAAKIHTTMTVTLGKTKMEEVDTSGGTLMYMSPEQLAGKWDKPTMDQYSLAATAYELFSGHAPFNAPNMDALRESIKQEIPEPLEDVAPAITEAVARALRKTPAERFISCSDFVDAMCGKSAVIESVPKPEPKQVGKKLSDEELIECLTLKEEILSFFNSFENEHFKVKVAALQQKFDQYKSNPEDSRFLEMLRNIFSACGEYRKNAKCYCKIEIIQKELSDLETYYQDNQIKFPEQYQVQRKVASELLAREYYEFALDKFSKLIDSLKKGKDDFLKESRQKAEMKTEEVKKILNGMVKVKAGTFTMGSPTRIEEKTFLWFTKTVGAELGRLKDEKQHQVTLTKDYWLGKYPVTQKEYSSIMGENPSNFKGDNYPVELVSWEDAKAFCRELNKLCADQLPSGYHFDLPTEAQWEYACRAGTTTALNNGKNLTSVEGKCPNLDEVAWYSKNSGGTTHPVGQKKANEWGLYDMYGNVGEWCNDWYGDYPNGSVTNPQGTKTGLDHVIRGGSWHDSAKYCRSASRFNLIPTTRGSNLGFRVALVPIQ